MFPVVVHKFLVQKHMFSVQKHKFSGRKHKNVLLLMTEHGVEILTH